jgi:hypothetical protein
MHHCLRIAEVFTNICDLTFDDPDNWDQEARLGMLSSLARTCKAFHEIALDGLWKVQMSVKPVLKTLPADAWCECGDPRYPLSSTPTLVSYARNFVVTKVMMVEAV